MRSTIASLVLFGAACLGAPESAAPKKKCSSVFPSSGLASSLESATASSSTAASGISTYSESSTISGSATSSGSESSTTSGSLSTSPVASTSSVLDDASLSSSFGGSSTVTSESSLTIMSSSSATTSATVQVVANDVGNGAFGSYDPNSPGGIADWDSENCEIDLQHGYQGSGSSDTGCVRMSAAPVTKGRKAKRTDYTAMIEQQLQDVDETSQYTIRFYYTILSNALANTCRMEAYYGDALLTYSDYFDVVTDAVAGNTPWLKLVDETSLSSSDGYIRFQLSCIGDGYAVVFIDEVFVSDKVDASSSDNISLLFTSTGSLTTTTTTTSSATPTTTPLTTVTDSHIDSSTTASYSSTTQSGSILSSVATSSTSTTSESASQSATDSTSASLSTSTTASSTVGSSGTTPTWCIASATATAGLSCGTKIYTNKSPYKAVRVADVTRDQCAAACLADSGCLSFSYYSTQTCNAVCYLQSASVANMGYTPQFGNGFPQVWDKGCFAQSACAAPASGQVCLDKMGSAPASTCQATIMGKAKSCAKPFASASVSGLCGSGGCMALCKQYPGCKSYSATYGSSVTCNFYSESINAVADAASSSTIFSDISCNECGVDSSVFNWLDPLANPSSMPDLSACTAGTSTTGATSSSTTVSSTTTSSTTSSQQSSTTSFSTTTTSTSSTTTSTSSTSTSCVTCAVATPAPSGLTCGTQGVQGDVNWDAWGTNTGNQNSVMDCAALCYKDSSCQAYGFNPNSNSNYKCAFIQISLSSAGFYTSSTANYYWNDKACSTCSESCSSSSSSSSITSSTASSIVSTGTASSSSLSTTFSTMTITGSQTSSSAPSTITGSSQISTTSTSSSASASASSYCSVPSAKLVEGITCGLPGSNSNSATTVETVTASGSLSTCAYHCLMNSECLSFRYSSSDTSCYVYSTSMDDDGLAYVSSSTTRYYDKQCFYCV
ncbi:hypothetical protein AB5N19_06945 [Seiridium cardinale]|uniref:Apple domain-containing protein n=1 Tax=Seiridium cardinale TaxID=138064 RepID=A0ABR2XJQ7_9PEZI